MSQVTGSLSMNSPEETPLLTLIAPKNLGALLLPSNELLWHSNLSMAGSQVIKSLTFSSISEYAFQGDRRPLTPFTDFPGPVRVDVSTVSKAAMTSP